MHRRTSLRDTLYISPQSVDVNGLFHDNDWPGPSPIVDWDWSEMNQQCNPDRQRTQVTNPKQKASAASVKQSSTQPVSQNPSVSIRSVASTCPESVRGALQRNVIRLCKGAEQVACKGNDDCSTLAVKMEAQQACMNARWQIMVKCYKGGDASHKEQYRNRLNGFMHCQGLFAKKCGNKSPVPQPKPVPVNDPDFMKKMEQLTGLSGAALIIYLIISEGSRLFPPRNVIPIP